MRLETLEYLLIIDHYGSLNKAAKHLYLSQPNLTKSIQALENELGFEIMVRTNKGVEFTPKGREVVLIAKNMLEEKNRLLQIKQEHCLSELKIMATYNEFTSHAFISVINDLVVNDHYHLELLNGDVFTTLEAVYKNQVHLGVIIYNLNNAKQVYDYIDSHQLLETPMQKLSYAITIREDHPLLQENNFPDGLYQYPYVEYNSAISREDLDQMNKYVNPQKKIIVDDYHTKRLIISQSNAFGIGISQPQNILKQYRLIQYPLIEHLACISLITRKKGLKDQLVEKIRGYLKKELVAMYR